jgi:hypothetical protein
VPPLATRNRHRTVTGYVVLLMVPAVSSFSERYGTPLAMGRDGKLASGGKVAHLFTSSGRAWSAVARSRTTPDDRFTVVPVGRHP